MRDYKYFFFLLSRIALKKPVPIILMLNKNHISLTYRVTSTIVNKKVNIFNIYNVKHILYHILNDIIHNRWFLYIIGGYDT